MHMHMHMHMHVLALIIGEVCALGESEKKNVVYLRRCDGLTMGTLFTMCRYGAVNPTHKLVPPALRAGSVILYNPNAVHCGGGNPTSAASPL